MNVIEALNFGEVMLREYGISDPRWNAERLLLIALKVNRAQLLTNLKNELSLPEENAYRAMLSRRALHYPLAYLEGVQEFYGREFKVNESVLIPRPETEEIIRSILKFPLPSSSRILDVGAGSGAISVTLSEELRNANVTALERSPAAIRVLSENAQGKISVVRGDLYHLPFSDDSFDAIVSNPPYVEISEFEALPAETRWEPKEALVAFNDVYPTLLEAAGRILKHNGYLVFEIGFGQSARIQELSKQFSRLKLIEILQDYQKIPRTFVLQKRQKYII